MITLRLFEASNPFQQIDERVLGEGGLTIGRDPSADWAIHDAHGDMSRKHCVICLEDGRVCLIDTSSNGIFIGPEKRAAPKGQPVPLAPGETLHLSQYQILVDVDVDLPQAPAKPGAAPIPPPATGDVAPLTEAGLLERFCMGAGLEASSFAGEDPGDVMARLGSVYRQVVDDLCELMRDRAGVKNDLKMDRTTISARDNNPLKWAPPQRIAVELLQEGQSGFLKGAAAFRASFHDLRRHSACLMAGSRSAVRHVLEELDPDTIDAATRRQPLSFVSRHEAMWKRHRDLHADLAAQTKLDGNGRIGRSFRTGYEQHLAVLDAEGGGT